MGGGNSSNDDKISIEDPYGNIYLCDQTGSYYTCDLQNLMTGYDYQCTQDASANLICSTQLIGYPPQVVCVIDDEGYDCYPSQQSSATAVQARRRRRIHPPRGHYLSTTH